MTPFPGQWSVELVGDAGDLEHLAGALSTARASATVYRDARDGKFALASESFSLAATSDCVVELAAPLLLMINGALRLTLGRRAVISLGAVFQEDDRGTKNHFVQIEGLEICTRMGTPTALSGKDGISQPPAASSPMESLLGAGETDPTVGKILRLYGHEDFETWVALYRVYEVIEAAVGGNAELTGKCLGSQTQRRRFKHSASSVSVGGDDARHGAESLKPPKDPMAVSEAVEYISRAVSAYLTNKGQ